jgi:iron-sulfur cluster repair protein YtfE (RIC family)
MQQAEIPSKVCLFLQRAFAVVAFAAISAVATAMEESAQLEIPKSMQAEHQHIHSALVAATRAEGPVGAAARELAQVLEPHFKREEQIALPPLGLLAPLAAGGSVPAATAARALNMSDALRAELPRMLEEHKRIRESVRKLRDVSRNAQAHDYERLADELALHAQTEEEVLYPAAILVGDLLRARQR